MDIKDFILNTLVDNYRTFAMINVYTMELYLYKFEGNVWPTPRTAIDGTQFIKDYMNSGKVYEEDLWEFEKFLRMDELVHLCINEKKNFILSFRIIRKGKRHWMRMEISVPRDFSAEKPFALIHNYDMNSYESDFFEACYIFAEYTYKVLRINLNTLDFSMIKELPSETDTNQRLRRGSLDKRLAYGRETYIHPDDLSLFQEQMKREKIINHFKHGDSCYLVYYRRRIAGLYRWVKLVVLPSSTYTKDNPDFFIYILDVHREILETLDIIAGINFTKYYHASKGKITHEYYESLLGVLSGFTQKYVDYTMIDLQKDICVRYKMNGPGLKNAVPIVRNYDSTLMDYLKQGVHPVDHSRFDAIDSSDKLRHLLQDKITYEITFHGPSGKPYKLSLRKTEAVLGVPTKVLCYTSECITENQLKVTTFGNFHVLNADGKEISFPRKQAKEVLAYLIDKHGYPVSSKDIAMDVLEKSPTDNKAIKYVSTLLRNAITTLEKAGYPDIIIKDSHTYHANVQKLDCDLYHLLDGDISYWDLYHNEYMKEFSWAEETNAEILSSMDQSRLHMDI